MRRKINKTYWVSDFETTSKIQYDLEKETRVYLHYTENVYTDECFLGTNIEEYFNFITRENDFRERRIIFFHNLRFDILFLEYYLNRIGYRFSQDNEMGTYSVIRDDKYNVYQFTIYYSNKLTIEFRDSLKLFNMSVDKLPNIRGIDKLDYDYKKVRNEKVLEDFSSDDLEYVKHDVWKVKDILNALLEDIGDYLTIGSSSYADWKRRFNKEDKYNYSKHFPFIDDDVMTMLRKSYNGGIVILNEKYRDKIIDEDVETYDVNSLYPSVMRYRKMPFGKPQLMISKENYERFLEPQGYDLSVLVVNVKSMKIKKGYHPFISLTKSYMFNSKKKDEYPSFIEDYTFFWSNVDFENVLKYYDVEYEIYYDMSYCFKSRYGIFDEYIDFYNNLKENAKNEFERTFAKFRLNTLYGKYGTRNERFSYVSIWNEEEGKIEYELQESNLEGQYYLPLAIFITAFARDVLINTLQEERNAFIYCDTDSLHLLKSKIKRNFDIDRKRLGAWKYEHTSSKSKYIANKQYLKLIDGKLETTIASLNKSSHHLITFNNFKRGQTIKNGKKMMKQVLGGHIIVDTDFTFS